MGEINFNNYKVFPNNGSGSITPSQFNQAIDLIQRGYLASGVGYKLKRSQNGTILNIQPSVGGATTYIPAWNFKVYDATASGSVQVRVNSGDGFAGSINGNPAMLNDGVITTPISPAVAPVLSTPSTGYIYIQVYLNDDGSINTSGGEGSGVDILWSDSVPLQLDSATPPTYATQVIAQNTVSDSIQVVDNATNYGFTSFFLCGTMVQFS